MSSHCPLVTQQVVVKGIWNEVSRPYGHHRCTLPILLGASACLELRHKSVREAWGWWHHAICDRRYVIFVSGLTSIMFSRFIYIVAGVRASFLSTVE